MQEMKDCQFTTAEEKRKVLRQWERFLKGGLTRELFTKGLYHHLMQHCSFIAHYDINGFYDTYFTRGEDTIHFLRQFDKRNACQNGIPKSVEYGMTYWATGDYADINMAMIEIATPYIPRLINSAQACQRNHDVTQALQLLSKHGISFQFEKVEGGDSSGSNKDEVATKYPGGP